jgi:hypothetical protein
VQELKKDLELQLDIFLEDKDIKERDKGREVEIELAKRRHR